MEIPPVILASASAARQKLLRDARLVFTVLPADVDEAAVKAKQAGAVPDLALQLAAMKAAKISALNPGALVIGADQILVCGGKNFDKPKDLADAAAQLRALSRQWHELITAVCVYKDGAAIWREVAAPRLLMRELSAAFIAGYLAAEGEALCASVGAYRLEGPGIQLFERIDGDFFTILGLPLLPLLGFLRQAGVVAA